MTTDYVEQICKKIAFPKVPWPYQRDEVNRGVVESQDRFGMYWDMGAGKTFGSTLYAMIRRQETGARMIQLCPPILLKQWQTWLESCGIRCKVYYGTPAQRSKIVLDDETVYWITTPQMLKSDFDRLYEFFSRRPVMVVNDEATCAKNFESGNFRAVLQMAAGNGVLPMTGSPLSTPRDAYSYIKLVSPGIYRSYSQFENIHVEKFDQYKRPIKWRKLDMLARNLAMNSSFISTPEVHPDMPRANISSVVYDLEAQHMKMYKTLVDQQMLVYESGFAIDATTANKLHVALQQVVLNAAYFAQDDKMVPYGFQLLDEFITELRGQKLLVFANYKMSVNAIMQYLLKQGIDAVAVNGDVSKAQKDKNVERFKHVPACTVAVMNPLSGGVGVDGLQEICNHALFLEIPSVSKDFFQAVKRIERPGQKFICDIRVATALGTVQVTLRKNLVQNNGLIQQVVPSTADLRAQLLGQA
jgi:hypothetical protein